MSESKKTFDIKDMEAAFEAGMDLEAWNNRGSDESNKPKEFKEWIENYQESE